jgi:hypothetical protein
MITLREYKPEDYAMVASWWAAHKWAPVPPAVLPKLGVIAEREGGAVAALWLYMDNSVGVCWAEWLVSAPDAAPLDVYRSIGAMLGGLEAAAKSLGYGVMLTACRQAALVRTYERAGFQRTDEGVTHLLKHIGGL